MALLHLALYVCGLLCFGFFCVYVFVFSKLNILNPGILKQNRVCFYKSKPPKMFCNNASNTETFHVTSYVKGFAVTMVSRIETLKSHLTPSTDF